MALSAPQKATSKDMMLKPETTAHQMDLLRESMSAPLQILTEQKLCLKIPPRPLLPAERLFQKTLSIPMVWMLSLDEDSMASSTIIQKQSRAKTLGRRNSTKGLEMRSLPYEESSCDGKSSAMHDVWHSVRKKI